MQPLCLERRADTRESRRQDGKLLGSRSRAMAMFLQLERKEIAELFFDTHQGAMVRMIRLFIEGEEREDHARLLEAIEKGPRRCRPSDPPRSQPAYGSRRVRSRRPRSRSISSVQSQSIRSWHRAALAN
jgi:hypothetical protein